MPATGRPHLAQSKARRLQELIAGYTPLAGIPDEFIGPDGRPRAHWLRFLDALTNLSPEDMENRFDAADRHIHDTGVSYRAFGEAAERAWPLSHVPLLISESEWRHIERGVEQRVRLMEHIVSDAYGEGRLVSEGVLPAAVITGSPDYLQPLSGIRPPGGKFLQLYAVDLGRGPDGRWWVLGDRTQAPSGGGYALANRLVLSRAFPALYRDMNVERLAPFFQGFRSGLASLATRADPRICLLTPGPLSETYFEQAYLARYLGFMLVQGGDLTMRDGKVHVRTIAGLKRADVLWRRVDSDFADPLELNAASRLGVPGLVEVLRGGGVVVANALGSGLLETPALMGFMPSLCRHLLNEELALPNIATWWCGQARARGKVLADVDGMAIAGAFGNPVLDRPAGQSVIGSSLEPAEKQRLIAQIRDRGGDYVGQEVVHLSTTPVWQDGGLTPRPFVLRVYAAATADGWRIMPGGFARISDRADVRAVSMGEGVQSADVWMLAENPVAATTLLPTDDTIRIRRIMGNLPSRAADNLFWLGRYLERAEATLRLIRCLAGRLLDTDAHSDAQDLAVLKGMLGAAGAAPYKAAQAMAPLLLTATALHSKENYGSAASLVEDAQRAASSIRERLSSDTWRLIGALHERLDLAADAPLTEAEAHERADGALRVLAAISGLFQENMNRVAGWRFLDMGRRVERGITACRLARNLASAVSPAEDLDILLDLVDSQITYRSRYLMGVALRPVRDIVLLDPYNPRSLAFQVGRLKEHLESLPVLNDDGMMEQPLGLIVRLAADVAVADAGQIGTDAILVFEQTLMALADAVGARYFLQGPHAVLADKTSGLA
jgi:uncharacterized circularly permuted ATP-grasp superfamily protein/uncharacterized alpha-E superfamily protein